MDEQQLSTLPLLLEEETLSGQIPPYQLRGTMAVIQGQNLKINVDKLDEVFEVYFGAIYSLTDNKLCVFFRAQPQQDHLKLALSFLRDFAQKNSADQYSLKKAVLLIEESGDTLKISERFEKFSDEEIKSISTLAQFQHQASATDSYLQVTSFTSIEHILEIYRPIELGFYFRKADDLAQTLNYISEKILENESDEIKEGFVLFKIFKLKYKNESLLNAYKSLLNVLMRLYKQNSNVKTLVSACLTMAPSILSSDSLDDELQELLNWCLQFTDLRIKANALETLGYFDPDNPFIESLSSSRFNRIASEALIIQSRKGLTRHLTDQILGFLHSANPYFVASGLYIVGFICHFHSQQNFDEYSNNALFSELITETYKFKEHTHSMVRKRAKVTIQILESIKRVAA